LGIAILIVNQDSGIALLQQGVTPMMSPEGIVYFDTLGFGWVLEVKQIKEIFPEILPPLPDADRAFSKIFKEIIAR
jgi:hypothetical protein